MTNVSVVAMLIIGAALFAPAAVETGWWPLLVIVLWWAVIFPYIRTKRNRKDNHK